MRCAALRCAPGVLPAGQRGPSARWTMKMLKPTPAPSGLLLPDGSAGPAAAGTPALLGGATCAPRCRLRWRKGGEWHRSGQAAQERSCPGRQKRQQATRELGCCVREPSYTARLKRVKPRSFHSLVQLCSSQYCQLWNRCY